MKICFVYERMMPTVSLLMETFGDIRDSYDLECEFVQLEDAAKQGFDGYSAVLFIRPNDILSCALAEVAKAQGLAVITYCDDDLLNREIDVPWRRRGLLGTIKSSDCICSPNPLLCEKYKGLTIQGGGFVLPTTIDPSLFKQTKHEEGPVKIVYAANSSHVVYFNELVKPIMYDLIEEFGYSISFTFIGVHPDLHQYAGSIDVRYVPTMPFDEYRRYMETNHFDIGIAPLPDVDFHRYKYFNKYIEYTIAGIFGIYSNIVPYTLAVRNLDTGLLADNTRDGWLEAFRLAIRDTQMRQRGIMAAQSQLAELYTSDVVIRQFLEDVGKVRSTAGMVCRSSFVGLKRVQYRILKPFERPYLLMGYMSHGKWKNLVNRVTARIRPASFR